MFYEFFAGRSSRFQSLERSLPALSQNLLGLFSPRRKMRLAVPMWRNGRRNGLKIRFYESGVWVRVPPSAPLTSRFTKKKDASNWVLTSPGITQRKESTAVLFCQLIAQQNFALPFTVPFVLTVTALSACSAESYREYFAERPCHSNSSSLLMTAGESRFGARRKVEVAWRSLSLDPLQSNILSVTVLL